MDSTHAIACEFRSGSITPICLELSGTSLTAYSGTGFGNASYPSVVKLSSSLALLGFVGTNSGYPDYAQAMTLSLSGTTITNNTVLTIDSPTNVNGLSVCALDSTHAHMIYNGGSTQKSKACCLLIDGTDVELTGTISIITTYSSSEGMSYSCIGSVSSTLSITSYSDYASLYNRIRCLGTT
jgi:hypothetical protein